MSLHLGGPCESPGVYSLEAIVECLTSVQSSGKPFVRRTISEDYREALLQLLESGKVGLEIASNPGRLIGRV